eukprot:scaffold32674_cov29-Tisochrysis_lutea.AAC.4
MTAGLSHRPSTFIGHDDDQRRAVEWRCRGAFFLRPLVRLWGGPQWMRRLATPLPPNGPIERALILQR